MNKYIFDAGHGGIDPGCAGFGLTEKILTLEASLYLHNRCKQLGITSSLTRTKDDSLKNQSDKNNPNSPRTNAVKNSKATVCISSHFNAASSAQANGVETIHSIFSNGKLSNLILTNIVQASGGKLAKRKAFTKQSGNNDYYYMHRLTGSVETVIVEYGFLTSKKDTDFLKSQHNRYSLYEGVIKAICQYEGITYKTGSYENDYLSKPNTSTQTQKPQQPSTPSKPTSQKLYRVIAGSFANRDNASSRKGVITRLGIDAFLELVTIDREPMYRVVAGSYSIKSNADATKAKLSKEGIGSFIEEVKK